MDLVIILSWLFVVQRYEIVLRTEQGVRFVCQWPRFTQILVVTILPWRYIERVVHFCLGLFFDLVDLIAALELLI